jgi:glycerol kinase
MSDFILAMDQGTTSSRAIVFNGQGLPVGSAQEEFKQIYPQPGWVEHDPAAIWQTQLSTAQRSLKKAKISADDLAAIGITNQRETTLLWDRKTGQPVYNAIVWQCRRTAPMCERIKADGFDKVLRAKTGLVTDAYFSGTKLAWLLENVDGVRLRAQKGELAFGTVDSFLLWRLTNGELHITDPSNASRTLLYNIYTGEWDQEILDYLKIPPEVLPQVQPSSYRYGQSASDLLGKSVPLAGIAGDQQAATFGQACFQPGMAKNTYGTGCFMLLNTGHEATPSESGLLTTIGWTTADAPDQPIYCLEGSVFIAGAAVQWLRDELGLIKTSQQIEPLAASVEDNGGVYFVPAFVGLGAPYWDSYARGTIVGLTRGSSAGHLARATLESIAFQTRDVTEAMLIDSGQPLETLRVDGGAAVNDQLMQFQADILGVPVERPEIAETTALGAAYLAGLAVEFWQSAQEIQAMWRTDKTFEPCMGSDQREHLYAQWKKAVERAKAWENK